MATKSTKGAAKKRSQDKKPESNNPAYVRLRTVLDSLEIGSIRYFLAAPTSGGKQKRLEKLQKELMPIIEWLWNGKRDGVIDCPCGYTNCHGVCVPYGCPDRPIRDKSSN